MVTSFNKQWVWFYIVYTQLISSGLGAALTAKIDKSNTAITTNITMQSLNPNFYSPSARKSLIKTFFIFIILFYFCDIRLYFYNLRLSILLEKLKKSKY